MEEIEEPSTIGNWCRISCLGSGSFGVVSLWKNEHTSEFTAIKKCKLHKVTDKQKNRWKDEVYIMQQLNHNNIVTFKALPEVLKAELNKYNLSRLPLLSMEYCAEGNLRHTLRKAHNICGMQEQEVRDVLGDISNALCYLHDRNITHRDIKPENIVLQKSDARNGIIYKLIDLGYAKELESTLSLVGTLTYVAPEILENKEYYPSVDYWSFGIVVYEIISGTYPFLPQDQPFNRIKHIAQKSHQDICIYYENNKGRKSIKRSSEIKQSCHISACLKRNIEQWLQLAFEYDPKQRGRTITGQSIFAELQNVLNKKTVTVFSLYTYEFYYYEVNDYTLLSTLKDWIIRDTKIPRCDLMLFTKNKNFDLTSDDEKIALNTVCEEYVIYVFKKGSFMNGQSCRTSPRFLREASPTKTCTTKELWSLCSRAFYYVVNEKKHMEAVGDACEVLNKHLTHLCTVAEDKYLVLEKLQLHLLTIISCYNRIHEAQSKMLTKYVTQLKGCWDSYNELILKTQQLTNAMNELKKRLIRIHHCRNSFSNASQDVLKLIAESKGVTLQRIAEKLPIYSLKMKHDEICSTIFKVVSESIRNKDTLFNQSLSMKTFIKCSFYLSSEVNKLISWTSELQTFARQLYNDYNEIEYKIHSKVYNCPPETEITGVNFIRTNFSYNGHNYQAAKLIEENRCLRVRLEELINQSLYLYKTFCDYSLTAPI